MNRDPAQQGKDHIMKVLESIGGVVVGVVTLLILAVGALFAVGSIGRYLKAKSM